MTTTTQDTNVARITSAAPDRSTFLRRVFYANADISLLFAFLLVLFPGSASVAQSFGLENALGLMSGSAFFGILGLAFIPFAGLVFYTATRRPIDKRLVWFVIAMDSAWVILSILVLLTNVLNLNTAGNWAVLLQADVVLVLAVLQIIGVRRIKS
jgi:hypothetical protein